MISFNYKNLEIRCLLLLCFTEVVSEGRDAKNSAQVVKAEPGFEHRSVIRQQHLCSSLGPTVSDVETVLWS